jgi:hypothetical protein
VIPNGGYRTPIFLSRPLAEATEETLIRRKTAARNYENVVKKDAKFFQCIGSFGEHRENRGEHVVQQMWLTELLSTGFRSESGSVLDPDSIRSVDPDPDSESGSGSRRAKMTHKSRKNLRHFMF